MSTEGCPDLLEFLEHHREPEPFDPSALLLKKLEICEIDPNVSLLEKKKLEKKMEFPESSLLQYPVFKRSDPMFNSDTERLAIKVSSEGFRNLCLMCSEYTAFKTSCCGHALCDSCIDDCEANCFHCSQPLGFITFRHFNHYNPNFEGLLPSFSIEDFAVKPLYPEYCFLDFYGVSCSVSRFNKREVPEELYVLNSDELSKVYFATRGRCPPIIGTNFVAPSAPVG